MRTFFFAVREDLEENIRAMEAAQPYRYYLTGVFDSPPDKPYLTLLDIPGFGINPSGDHLAGGILVLNDNTPLSIRSGRLTDGSEKSYIDQKDNPRSFILLPGGLYGNDTGLLIGGEINSLYDRDTEVEVFMKEFTSLFLKGFIKVRNRFISPGVMARAVSLRLITMNVSEKPEYDFQL